MKYKVNKKRSMGFTDTGGDVSSGIYINELDPIKTEEAINDLDERITRHEKEVEGPVRIIKELQTKIGILAAQVSNMQRRSSF